MNTEGVPDQCLPRLTDAEVAERAKAAGFQLESWATNPPRPAMWHGTPEAMRKLIEGR